MSITFHHAHLTASAAPSQFGHWVTGVMQRAALAFWRATEAYGQHRSRQHMLRLASQYDYTYPETARHMRAAAHQISQ